MTDSIRYIPTDPELVDTVGPMLVFTDEARTDLAATLTPGVEQTDGSWLFYVTSPLDDGTYYLSTTVLYTDTHSVVDANDTITVPFLDSGLVTVEQYRALTGDNTTDRTVVAEQLRAAQQLVEEYLRRPLELAERTERMRLYDLDGTWTAFPKATPVLSATGYTIVGAGLVGATPDVVGGPFARTADPFATITYTGGWSPVTLPLTVAREIAQTARALIAASTATVPAGATSVRVGDLAVTYGSGSGGALGLDSRQALRGYVRRRAA